MAYEPVWMKDPSALNKFELVKMEKDGLDVIRTIIDQYAKEGYDSIPEDDMSRFKWAGVYEQKPRDGHFMMRVRIPTGITTAPQVRALASIARDYGRNLIDVTTRQAIQYHWLRVENLPDIFNRLEEVGLYSYEACGDCPRTIVGNPLAGIDKDELIDTIGIVEEVSNFFLLNRDFSNLPRKYKMSITGNIYNNANAEINDLAFVPASKVIDGQEIIGFHAYVGGGLSAKPHMAQELDIFIRPEEVLKTAIGVTTIFRDYGYRQKRHHARLKFLVADWGVEKFKEKLIELIGDMPSKGTNRTIGWNAVYYDGVYEQKQEGLHFIGLNVPVGRTEASEFEQLADIAEKYGDGKIRTTMSQNIILSGIPAEKLEEALQSPVLQRLSPQAKTFMSRTVSCTGNEFCNLAVVETKELARDVAEYLDAHVELDEKIRIHIIGCPNACGQKHIADIGLQGALIRTPDGTVDAFDIAVGGILGPGAKFNTTLKGRVKSTEIGSVLAKLITFYKDNREAGESFHNYVNRVGAAAFQEKLNDCLAQPTSA
ncbi:nitrite/sulfite reductase [Paenibacillus spongiae]|uniref:Nitrite/sulfite reductase n=1 Tax=Paenibacillus spongiae TaxID=2909671 RepID=A0ABY5S7F6_9BACL|nr:nitrite/sulfite reductase [Paenibacillus spongiae]UVI29861.1 nitrite/sulfite reductase [Paenibacillus spongiae]